MYKPYSYQTECLNVIESVRAARVKRALVVMASGLGKTVTMAFDAKAFRERQGGGRVLFLCHNNDILYQAKTTFEAVNGVDKTYGYFHGEEKHLHHVDFLFASFQTMERSRELFNPDEFAYVIVDESHHSQANTYRSTIEYFRPEFLLGATATPDRLDQLNIREIFGHEVYYLPLEEAMARGLVTPVDYRLLTDEIVLSEELTAENGDRVSLAELNRKVFIPKRDEEIASIVAWHVADLQNPRIMVFCTSIRHCEHLAKFIPDSFAIHSKIPDRERAVRLEMFRQGVIGTVLTINAFNEGIDIPQANAVVFLRQTTSNTVFLQQLGRGLRKSDGKDKVIALDFVANCERIKMVHNLWRRVEDTALQHRGESGLNQEAPAPMMLNVNSVNFTETIVPLMRLMDRVRPKRIAEIEHLLKEYSPRNPLPADRVAAGSSTKFWWVCSACGHEWFAAGNHRLKGSGCPACAGKVATATNNLLVTRPDLAEEYSPKNTLPPNQVIAGTAKKLLWLCRTCGHEWRATGNSRISNGTGCTACAGLAVNSTNNLAVKFPKLVAEYSAKNSLPPREVLGGGKTKRRWICPVCTYEYAMSVYHRLKGFGCPGCSWKSVTPFNNLVALHPDLAREYSEKNSLPPNKMPGYTKHTVWWECSECGHEWLASVHRRAHNRTGCPGCKRVVVTSSNNMVVTHPELVKEYSEKNEISATQLLAGTNRVLWWRCNACLYEWQASGNERATLGRGCPGCAEKVWTPLNNFAALYPELAKEYSELNAIPADQVVGGPKRLAWWRCSVCSFQWRARIYDRAMLGGECKLCWRDAERLRSLVLAHPLLMTEYSPRNVVLLERILLRKTDKRLRTERRWICSSCGRQWHSSIFDRIRKRLACPFCLRKKERSSHRCKATVQEVNSPLAP